MIRITIVSYNNEAPHIPISAIFGAEQGTIGRSEDNFLSLPDPRCLVSRSQAKVWSNGTRHQLINVSLANPILINGKEIEPERVYDIEVGDQIQIGLYLLRVDAGDTDEIHLTSGLNLKQPPSSSDLDAPPVPPADLQTRLPQPARQLPSKFAPSGPGARKTIQPPQFLLRTDSSPIQADNFPTPEKTPNEQVHASQSQTTQSLTSGEMMSIVPLSETAQAIESAKSSVETNDLLQAFLNGADLSTLSISSGLTAELMETLGKLVATSVQGTMALISQRALVKREVNAELTMVVLQQNNPLKFFPDSQTVLTQMLRKKIPGFMAPVEAMEDAFLDLRAHQLGVIAGMKAAKDALLKKIQPLAFEAYLSAPTLLDYINPARRKAVMWDHFSALFEDISIETSDEYQSLFGKEFLIAYENEVERVKHEPPYL